MTGMNVNAWIVAVCVLAALLMLYVQHTPALGSDTVLSIIGHSALALGTVALTFLPDVRVDLMGYLFGDILAVTRTDIGLTWGMALLVVVAMVFLWRPLLAIAVHAELAQVEGVRVWWVSAAYMVLVALMVAVAMKVVGVLLLTALLFAEPQSQGQMCAMPALLTTAHRWRWARRSLSSTVRTAWSTSD